MGENSQRFSLSKVSRYMVLVLLIRESVSNALLYTWKVSSGENFTTCSHWQKIYHANFLSRVNDCIEDMATMTALTKNLSMHQNTKVAGLGKIENFHVHSILSTQCLRKSYA